MLDIESFFTEDLPSEVYMYEKTVNGRYRWIDSDTINSCSESFRSADDTYVFYLPKGYEFEQSDLMYFPGDFEIWNRKGDRYCYSTGIRNSGNFAGARVMRPFYDNVEIRDYSMLILLLKMYEKWRNGESLELLLNGFIESYGLPMCQDGETLREIDAAEGAPYDIEMALPLGFSISQLEYHLKIIQCTFLAWRYTSFQDADALEELQSMHDSFGYLWDGYSSMRETLSATNYHHFINLAVFRIKTGYKVTETHGSLRFVDKANSCIDIAKLQLARLCVYGEGRTGGKTVAHCAQCGEAFIRAHGGKKYCDMCGSGAGRAKIFRERAKAKKEAVANANQTSE